MCPPDFYNIEYSINPWMDTKNKVNKEYAIVQYTDLKNSFQNAGEYKLMWNGKDNNNLTVASGVYLLHISNQNEEKIIKIIKN